MLGSEPYNHHGGDPWSPRCGTGAPTTLDGVPIAAELARDYDALRHGLGAVWVERDVVRVVGPGAVGYLQGQLSQDVSALAVGESAPSLLLSPQGKVDAWLRVTRVADDACVLDVDAGWGEAVMARLGRFKLRTKMEMTLLADWRCLALRGPGTASLPGKTATGARGNEAAGLGGGLTVPSFWPGAEGFDLLGESVDVPEGAVVCGLDALTCLRVEAGIPAMGSELGEKTIPAEAGLVEASVSFTKGCYTGQELVARLDSRGNRVPRRLRGVVVSWDLLGDPELSKLPPVGAELSSGDKVVGSLTTVASSPGLGAVVALAYVRREVEPPAELTLQWGNVTVAVVVKELPLVGSAAVDG